MRPRPAPWILRGPRQRAGLAGASGTGQREVLFRAILSAVLLIAATASRGAHGENDSTSAPPRALAALLDERMAAHRTREGLDDPGLVDDATFMRRAYLDLIGTIPTVSEVRDFLDEQSRDKRARLIDRLVGDPRYAEHFARVWRRMLVPANSPQAAMGAQMDEWLQQQFQANVPYDEMARRLVTAGGADALIQDGASGTSVGYQAALAGNTPVAYLQAAGGQPAGMTSSICRVFLGVRLECAQCHDHPFSDWRQEQFWGVAAFFAGARLTAQPSPGGQAVGPPQDEHVSEIALPGSRTIIPARYLWTDEAVAPISEGQLPRRAFAEWLTAAENPYFSATAVNRMWQYLCGYGLTESVDDLDQATGRQRAVVLDDLAGWFADSGFDLKWLIAGVCKSEFYARPSESQQGGTGTLRSRPLKVLSPEQLFDTLEIALALPISRIDQGPRYNGQRDQLVARMSEALGQRPDDFRSGVPQALMLLNGRLTAEATDLESSRTLRAVVDAPFLQPSEKIETLFMATLTRPPERLEIERFLQHIDEQSTPEGQRAAYSEILWALINSPEFVLSR